VTLAGYSRHSAHGKRGEIDGEQEHSCSQCSWALERQLLGTDEERGPQPVVIRKMSDEERARSEAEAEKRRAWGDDYLPYGPRSDGGRSYHS
jgi:hypothetical protein